MVTCWQRRTETARLGGGTYLGITEQGRWRLAGHERAVLLLGPPRSGKTQAVMIPALLAHSGSAVSASTKPDLLRATAGARSRIGEVWEFDPTGHATGALGRGLRWVFDRESWPAV